MNMREITIAGYRSCRSTSFELHPNLSVLIGPNGSGKTNVLTGIMLLKKLTDAQPWSQAEEKATGQSTIGATFSMAGKTAKLVSRVMTDTDENNSDVILSSEETWYAKDFTGNRRRLRCPLHVARLFGRSPGARPRLWYDFPRHRRSAFWRDAAPPEPARKCLGAIADYLYQMKYYSASQFTNPANCPVSFEIEKEGLRRRTPGQSWHTTFLYDLYVLQKESPGEKYEQFFSTVGPSGIGLIDKIGFKEIATSSIDYSVRSGGKIREEKRDRILVVPQFTIGTHELSPNQLSEGTFRTITLLFYLITQSSTLLLIEEPEVCVHHGLLASIIELIKNYSRDKQIIVSTHSDFVLDHVSPENVYRVSVEAQSGTRVEHIPKSMSRREYSALRRFLKTSGNLGEYWKHTGLG